MDQENKKTSITDKLGAMLGLCTAFVFIVPISNWVQPYVYTYALRYVEYDNYQLVSWLWMGCLFVLLVCTVWFCFAVLMQTLATILSFIVVKLTLKR